MKYFLPFSDKCSDCAEVVAEVVSDGMSIDESKSILRGEFTCLDIIIFNPLIIQQLF